MMTLLNLMRSQKVLFRVDNGERDRELLEKFLEKSGEPVLTQCLRNRLEYGSRYPNSVEQKIQAVIDQLELENTEPPWLHLLD